MNRKEESILFNIFNIVILILALTFSIFLVYAYFSGNVIISEQALRYGLPGIFFFTMLLEISIQFIGPDILIIAGLVSKMNLLNLTIVTILGSWIGGSLGYYIGLTNGERIASIFVSKKRFLKGCDVFHKYGNIGMTIVAITPLPYFPMVAGIFKMKLKNFWWYALVPRALKHVAVIYVISYFL